MPGISAIAGAIGASLWACVCAADGGSRTPLVDLGKGDALAVRVDAAARDGPVVSKFYQIVGGKVDARTYNGFRRYHGGCNRCHGQDGVGSTFAPSLVERLSSVDAFRRIVSDGRVNGTSVMKASPAIPTLLPMSTTSTHICGRGPTACSAPVGQPDWSLSPVDGLPSVIHCRAAKIQKSVAA